MLRRLPCSVLLCVALLFACSISARAADLEIVRVFTGWHDAASFQRVSEFFTGRENTGGIVMLRSQPAERAGFYWLVRLKNNGAARPGAKFRLQVVTPSSPAPKTFVFPATLVAGSKLYEIGLTGADWPVAKAQPAAWQLSVLGASGQVLLSRQSFLWALPAKP